MLSTQPVPGSHWLQPGQPLSQLRLHARRVGKYGPHGVVNRLIGTVGGFGAFETMNRLYALIAFPQPKPHGRAGHRAEASRVLPDVGFQNRLFINVGENLTPYGAFTAAELNAVMTNLAEDVRLLKGVVFTMARRTRFDAPA